MRTTHLLYLHGFRSSPQSAKAQIMAQRVQALHPSVSWWCPQLPASPKQAIQQLIEGTAAWPSAHSAVVGSSLGGFYAAWLARHQSGQVRLVDGSDHALSDFDDYLPEILEFLRLA